jgi:RHS repeat-associated protein
MTDANGTVVWKALYSPFGNATVTTSTIENNLRFPGQYYDAETGLHYNYHRYYNPKTGRYITADPIGLMGGVNLYGYVGGNPVRWVDPLGLFKIKICLDSKKLTLLDDDGNDVFSGSIVKGCKNTPTPTGKFRLGRWQEDKTTPRWGEDSRRKWSQDWAGRNVFGPYFVPVNGANGVGIHGHYGPKLPGSFAVSQIASPCSHGCIRLSNYDTNALHDLLPNPAGTLVEIVPVCK